VRQEPRAICDFETRSQCDLRKHGSWRYSLDPTTSVLCMAFRVPSWPADEFGLWHPALPHLDIPEEDMFGNLVDLFDWILAGGIVEAHNAWFERGVWTNICVPRHAFPPVLHTQWRCSAAKAAALSLPRALGDVAAALRLPIQKDKEGHLLMKKVSKPRKALKREGDEWLNDHGAGKCTVCKGKGSYKRKPCEKCDGLGTFEGDVDAVPEMQTKWHETAEQLADLWLYCGTDVLAEAGVSADIPDLPEAETDLYLLDQAINERGFQLDPAAVDTALTLIAQETADLNVKLAEVTGGQVLKATQRERMKKWFATQGLYLDNTQGTTIDAALEGATGIVREALGIVRELGRSSTSKYQAMSRWMCPDGRVRGGLLYHGASTGRWSGAGVQPHNFVRGTVKDQVQLWDVLSTLDREFIREEYGSVMLALANALRGAICAAPGHKLYVADYASIEARVIIWLAEDEEHLAVFLDPKADIYCEMASRIYERPINKKDHPDERQLGKVAILGLGYQMGAKKFVDAAANFGITLDADMSQTTVDAYRDKFWRIVEMWSLMERAAMEAISTRQRIPCGRVIWFVEDRFLYCQLPSGRRLAYPFPEVQTKLTSWGEPKLTVTFEGINPYSRRWERQGTYGGMLVENIVQAISRDIMAEAMLRCELSGTYQPVLSVHDELVAEAKDGTGNVKEFEALLTQPPVWALDCPIVAEGYSTFRYRK
jgi:DNA polymerase